ncbi:DNA primase family protein [Nonomuraea insulae]|uniref:Phage/plasmid primase, P4 family n=1 Tax=Nonomuraea insulae TaxID=1616787 RepID=A0ABW1DCQ6_9ACTN
MSNPLDALFGEQEFCDRCQEVTDLCQCEAEDRPVAEVIPISPSSPAATESVILGVEQHRGQLRMAHRFIREHARGLRHVHGIGWHKWDGARWLLDDQRADIEACVATINQAVREADGLTGQAANDLRADVHRVESASGAEGMLKFAAALRPITTASKSLDADPYQFNMPSGTLDLRTAEVRPNRRDDLITKVAGGSVEGVSSEEWEVFLKRILPDEEVCSFVQRLFGYAMLGKVTEHRMPIFTGAGANGKGTLRDAVLAAFGDYAIEIDPAMLMESRHERHGAFKMRLRGARLAFCSETEKGRRFAEATMKRLVGGDQIEANYMHKNPITFDPSHTLIMLTNFLPKVSGDDPAVWRRILVVPFDVVIPEEERDGELPGRLKAAASAVLAWTYRGWLDYQAGGLNPPDAVMARTRAYQESSDTLARFLSDRTHAIPAGREKARDLFTAWSAWCLASGEEPGTEVAFADSMANRGFEKARTSAGNVYRGLVLTVEMDESP